MRVKPKYFVQEVRGSSRAIPKTEFELRGLIDRMPLLVLFKISHEAIILQKTLVWALSYLKNNYTCLIKQWRINSKCRSTWNRRCICRGVEPPLGDSRPNYFKYRACDILDFCCALVEFYWISWPLKIRPTCCPETTVSNYPFPLRAIQEERKISSETGHYRCSRLVASSLKKVWVCLVSTVLVTVTYTCCNMSLCPGFSLQCISIQFNYLKGLKPCSRLV